MLAVGIFFWRWIICDAMHAAFRELWPRKVHYSGSVMMTSCVEVPSGYDAIEDCMETLLRNADVSPLLAAHLLACLETPTIALIAPQGYPLRLKVVNDYNDCL